jgi:hypothetical protein
MSGCGVVITVGILMALFVLKWSEAKFFLYLSLFLIRCLTAHLLIFVQPSREGKEVAHSPCMVPSQQVMLPSRCT